MCRGNAVKNTYLLAVGIFFLALFYSNFIAAEDIENMVATPDHLHALSAFYTDITVHDAAKIVIYPERVRGEILLESINQGRYFIAVDTITDSIVSVAKVFLITDPGELWQILTSEIRSTHHDAEPIKRVRYEIPYGKVFDFTQSLDMMEVPSSMSRSESSLGSFASLSPSPTSPVCRASPRKTPTSPSSEDYHTSRQPYRPLYIYMGGFYTKPGIKYRGQGINTKLQEFALTHLLPQVTDYINTNDSFSICCVFGQVEANKKSKATTRVFAKYVNEKVRRGILYLRTHELNKPTPVITLTLNRYPAFKPAFYLTDDNNLAVYPDTHPCRIF